METFAGSLSNAIERIYQGFILRDLVGFTLPGAVSLLSLVHHFRFGQEEEFYLNAEWFFDRLKESVSGNLSIVIFILLSYLTAWILQTRLYPFGVVQIENSTCYNLQSLHQSNPYLGGRDGLLPRALQFKRCNIVHLPCRAIQG